MSTPRKSDASLSERGERLADGWVAFGGERAELRAYVTRVLEAHGCQVDVFSDGLALLDALRLRRPDLLLCDVALPGLDGFALVRAVRNDPGLRDLPVMLLCAQVIDDAFAEGIRAGADDYLVEPFSSEELVTRVTARLGAVRAARVAQLQRTKLGRHLMNAPFAVTMHHGPEHVVELANAVALDWLGKGAEITGLPLREAVPELSARIVQLLDEVLRTGETSLARAERVRLIARDHASGDAARERYLNLMCTPLLAADGGVEGVLTCAFDVTELVVSRQRLERAHSEAETLASALRMTSRRLEEARRVAGIGLFDWDFVRGSAYASPELHAWLGTGRRLDRDFLADVVARAHEEDRPRLVSAVTGALAAGCDHLDLEGRIALHRDESRWVRVCAHVEYDDARSPLRAVGGVIDIQPLKAAGVARELALEEAERAHRAKDEFLAMISHELRAPLHAVLGWTEQLRAQPHDAEQLDRGLEIIERQVRTQVRLVDDLLDVSRIVHGKLRLALGLVHPGPVIAAAMEVVRGAADRKGVTLRAEGLESLPPLVVDPERLQQVVWNLLANAIRFTPSEGAVVVRAHCTPDALEIAVTDTGVGLSPEELAVVFERFRQIDSPTTRAHGGLGLGLSIVRHLVEAHGGSVTAHSEGVGRGAAFTVRLPLSAAGDVPRPRAPRAESAAAPAALRGVRALVVDDDPDALELLCMKLQAAGAQVTARCGAEEALAGELDCDVLISDLALPGMDGHALLRALRARTQHLPAIALTGHAGPQHAQQAYEAGFQEHLSKPVDSDQLISAVLRVLAAVPS